ncbi:YraN family protein [Novispirillum sp. DQ9]|uniref:YraN family protein n=1 Tax=Novispirillum sp. DQ9 TaxID=3398612 RepID=UPI003C7ECC05
MSGDDRKAAEARGRRAETLAALYLRFLGWSILTRRFTSGRGSGAGEVDLIARRGDVVAFIEVKARPTIAEALDALTPAQRVRIARGAEAWLQLNPRHAERILRFDVIAVPGTGRPLHLADAWRPEG